MTLRILVDENIPGVESMLGDLARVVRFAGRSLRAGDLSGVDALLVRSVTPVTQALLSGSGVRFVGSATSGLDHIDRHYLAGAGIGFAHAPGANANAVVEYVLAAIAAVDDFLERLLAGARVGIVGYGHVGRALAHRLAALGAQVVVSDPWLPPGALPGSADLPGLLDCDMLTLHCALTDESPWPSRHLLGPAALARLRPDSLLINASRGPVVDNAALCERLSGNDGLRCVLDVWEGEPALDTALLARVTIGTAHIAGYSLDGKWRATAVLCRALAAWFGLAPEAIRESSRRRQEPLDPSGESGAALVRRLIAARYDIRRDDTLLRQAVTGADALAVSEAFDRLRRHYPERRELAGSPVLATALTGTDKKLVRALGCECVTGGAP